MDVLILGANDQALNFALCCISKVKTITFFDQDLDSLGTLQDDIEDFYDENSAMKEKFRYSSRLVFDSDTPLLIFDYLPDNQKKLALLTQINLVSVHDVLFFTTSKLYSVSKIASLIENPRGVVGMQYLNSFENTKVIELVSGMHTSAKALEKAKWLMGEFGKEMTIVKDSPGFLLNRMTVVMINEAVHLLNEGVAAPTEIDKEMELSLGLNFGPLRLADTIGLDVVLDMLNSLYQGTGNPKYLSCSLLQNMVYSGYLGKKSNSGFYSYSAEILNFPHLNAY